MRLSFPKALFLTFLALLALLPGSAEAHALLANVTGGGFQAGLAHPFSGLDHLLAMFAVGIWAAQASGRFLWLAPLTFVLMMIVGGLVGFAAPSLPAFELGITGSVLVFGLAIAAAWNPHPMMGLALCGLFALFHGHAHGTEMPLAASPLAYGAGFVLATATLHITGIALGTALKKIQEGQALRLTGAAISVAGLTLLLA